MIVRLLRAFVVAIPLSVLAGLAMAACSPDRVALRGDWGQAQFTVEVVDEPAERSRGLMFRESLPRFAGMLFVYEYPQRVSFWMKNTLIPLDMIFVDETGLVRRIKHEAQPGDETSIPGGDDILVVLEINGGLAHLLGITPGSQMQHQVFDTNLALWPC